MIAGIVYMFAGNTAPEGFLICDGSLVSRSDYPDLFNAIGTLFGAGDGSTTFALPDLSGRIPIGASNTYAFASSGGTETVALDGTTMPSHAHTVPSHTHANTITATTPAYTHTVSTQPAFNYNRPNSTRTIYTGSGAKTGYAGTSSTNATLSTQVGIANHDPADCTMSGSISDCPAFNSGTDGGGLAHNNMQPYIVMKYVISTGE